MNEDEIKAVKNLIQNNNLTYKRVKPLQIKESDIFVDDEKETIKNVFNLIKNDYSYLNQEFKNKLCMKLADKMFDMGIITAQECITYHKMYRVYSFWGYML